MTHAHHVPTPSNETVLRAGNGRPCVTIMEIGEEEGRLWDAIVAERQGRRDYDSSHPISGWTNKSQS